MQGVSEKVVLDLSRQCKSMKIEVTLFEISKLIRFSSVAERIKNLKLIDSFNLKEMVQTPDGFNFKS